MISLLAPSRGRPQGLRILMDSATRFASREEVELIVRVDQDDETLEAYEAQAGPSVKLIVRERGMLSGMWQECAEQAQGEILMMAADDLVFRTTDWDQQILAAFPEDRIALVHGDDGGDRGRFYATHGFVSREWIDAVGYFVPDCFVSDYADRWLNDIANLIDRRFYVPILTEHMHPGFGKGPMDQTHIDRIQRHHEYQPERVYAATVPGRIAAATKLWEAIR